MTNTVSHPRSRPTFRPRLESLEIRLTPTTFTVSSLADSGAGSLRAAITSVNDDAQYSGDVIDFSVAGVIQLTSGALPSLTNAVTIDGTTAPGFTTAPVVELNAHGFAGLVFGANLSTLQSLSIVGASGAGVTLNGLDETVIGNFIGLALDGSVADNTGVGLQLNNSRYDTIGGVTAAARNVISGNGAGGIESNGPGGGQATIEGNFIGTDPTGQTAAANQGNGITLSTIIDTIGGTASGAGNTIAFNTQSGVVVDGAFDNVIQGNSIFSNNSKGIDLQNNGNANLPAPQLSMAMESPGTTTGSSLVQVGGVLNTGQDGIQCTIQVFATLSGVPAGQGQLFLGTVQVTANANGIAAFTLRNASVPAGGGTTFTATATYAGANLFGATSAFSSSIGTSTPNQAYVANVYQLLLNRIPDPSSSGWVTDLDNGTSPVSVVLGIEGSTEYLNDQVTAMYQLYLKRQPDTGGAQYWVSLLQAGGTFEEVAEGLTSSLEYFGLQGGTNQGFVTGLYLEVLNRNPNNAEIAGWETALDNGASRLDVSVAFLSSQEYRTNLVQSDYMTFLLRPANPGGLMTWVDALNEGLTDQQALAGIFGSPEGYQLWS